RVEVGLGIGAVALVVQRPARVPLADPAFDGDEAAATLALVGQGPDDHRRVVLVPFHHPGGAVQQGRFPGGVVHRVALPAGVDEPVRLQVALVHDPQAELVAQPEELRVRWVVRRAYRVDVVLLHQQDVLAHRLRAERSTVVRVVLVPVHPTQVDTPAIHPQHTVGHADGAEADGQVDRLLPDLHGAAVEAGHLRAPWLHGLYVVLGAGGPVDQGQPRAGYPALQRSPAPARCPPPAGARPG